MKLRRLMTVLAFLAAVASDSWGQSQQPTPPPAQSAQTNQASKPYERGTEQSPIIVKVLPTKEGEEKAAADAHREDEKTENDRRLARFTELLFWAFTCALSVIALFQLIVFGWQGIQLMRSVSATKEATELSNKEFISAHRPKIRIKHVWRVSGDVWAEEPITVRVVCVNHGVGDAILDGYGIDFLVVKKWKPLPPDHKSPEIKFADKNRLPSGISLKLDDSSSQNTITSDQYLGLTTQKASLYCIGHVHYRDGMNRLRTTSFCRVLELDHKLKTTKSFIRSDDPDYEYED